MELNEHQQASLDAFDRYLKELKAQYCKCVRLADIGEADPGVLDFPRKTWNALKGRGELPRVKSQYGELEVPQYIPRLDARKQPVPHVCFRVPTGSGKILLAAAALERLHPQAGIVLWAVPSQEIFRRTWRSLATRTHPCRQVLERTSGGRVKLFRQGDPISRLDVVNHLCLLPIMLQALGEKEAADLPKIIRDSGKYPGFFPITDGEPANQKMIEEHPDLHVHDLSDSAPAKFVKRSLFNVLKISRPIVILDEAHHVCPAICRKRLCDLNPRIMIELSTMPASNASNVLADMSDEDIARFETEARIPLQHFGQQSGG